MGGFTATELWVIGVIVLAVLTLIAVGLWRGRLKSAHVKGMGVTAGIEGHAEAKPLGNQTIQADGLKVSRSSIRMVKSARTSFRKARFTRGSRLEITPDDGYLPRPADPPSPLAGEDRR
ncbi:hypothetical protein ACPXCS_17925 [Streptomyces sp. DT190]|uniref:hypothetical protein n=1 Tax=unclassified Streptomyces TaxID=2593676 RepID=UPI003CEEE467